MNSLINVPRLRDGLWLILLIGYVLAGVHLVPFHGDESTIIWRSKDYAYIFLQGDLDRIRYSETPIDPSEQQLRLLNGPLTKYLIGLSWSSNGYEIEQINNQWDWGADWAYNQQFGHAPDDTLLMLGRWPSALMFAASVIAIFILGGTLGSAPVAYIASLYYTLNPVLLLNGRRAMFEGGLMLFTTLTVLTGLWFIRSKRWSVALLLGFSSGLAVCTKHPGAITVFGVFAGSAGYALINLRLHERRRESLQLLSKLFLAGIISLLVFYVMNPVWWGDPLERVGQVLDERTALLQGQMNAFGAYNSLDEQLFGLWENVFYAEPQYFEVATWADYIAGQITRYETSVWSGVGVGGGVVGGLLLLIFTLLGGGAILKGNAASVCWVIIGWATITLIIALITPLNWQRYYLLMYPIIGICAATGITIMVQHLPVKQIGARISATPAAR